LEFQAGVKTKSGYLAVPPSGRGPGVLVLHAWWGLNDFFVGLCDRLAGKGFVALAPDLYDGDIARTIGEAEALRKVKEPDETATQAKALEALDNLCRNPAVRGERVGAIGFSMGAYWAVLLSTLRPDAVAATVVFYGAATGDFSAANAAYVGHFAENDSWEPLEYVRQMEKEIRDAGKEATFHFYPGAGHWFFESDRPDDYNAESAALAWDRTNAVLRETLSLPLAACLPPCPLPAARSSL
jgi:carboxymethylenebutenolidase